MTKAIFLTLFLALAACSSGPLERARAYDRAVQTGQGAVAAAMADATLPGLEKSFQEAIERDRKGDSPTQSEWDTSRTHAEVTAGADRYLLTWNGKNWTVVCATIGPFHDRTPEMTLLLALHLIRKGDFEAFRRLAPSKLEQTSKPVPEEFQSQLKGWASEMAGEACRPFERKDDSAILRYGPDGRKTLKLRKEGDIWKIEDLW